MSRCSVLGCLNTSAKSPCYSFPKSNILRKYWFEVCGRPHIHFNKVAFMCHEHFDESAFKVPVVKRRRRTLKNDAIPTLKLPIPLNKYKVKLLLESIADISEHNQFVLFNGYDNDSHSSNDIQADIEISNEEICNTICNPKVKVSIKKEWDHTYSINPQNMYLPSVEELNGKYRENPNDPDQIIKNLKLKWVEREKELLIENERLKKTIGKISLEKIAFENRYLTLCKNLGEILSPAQVKYFCDKKSIRWTGKDITNASSLAKSNIDAYRYLRNMKFPLPALSTIRKWKLT